MQCKLIVLGLIIGLCGFVYAEKHIVCYYGTWANWRPGFGKFTPDNIDPTLCTHAIYTFFGITLDGKLRVLDPYLDLSENWGLGYIDKFNALKRINPKLKTLAAVGGWNEGSYRYSQVAKSAQLRKTFAQDATNFVLKHGFDGLDMDWEYPAQRDGDPAVDKVNFVLLLKDLKEALAPHGLILTAAVASAEFSSSLSYDIPQVSQYLDLINIMAYDLHGAWENTVGINAPMAPSAVDQSALQKQLNVDASVRYWINQGAPRSKIVLGVPLYGRTFTLQNPALTAVGSPATGAGTAGQYTREPGMLGYNEFCETESQWTRKWESLQKTPYAHRGNQWVGYDDQESLAIKMQYIKDMNLGGAMIWSLETDDFLGRCGKGKYPLLYLINTYMRDGGAPPTSAPPTQPPTHPTQPTQPTTPDPSRPCPYDGTFPNPDDCSKYYICHGGQQWHYQCAPGLLFDPKIGTCNWASEVECPRP